MSAWRRALVGGFLAAAGIVGAGGIESAAAPDAACDDDPACAETVESAREVAKTLASRLQQALQSALGSGDLSGAIAACNQMAPAYTQRVSTERGWRVTRVSLKPRNPLLGAPDAWEQEVLRQFDRAAASGEDPATLERIELVEEPQGKRLRYMKALPVQAPCVTCHGPTETLASDVAEALRAQYPHDRAVGYALGELRGALSVKVPID